MQRPLRSGRGSPILTRRAVSSALDHTLRAHRKQRQCVDSIRHGGAIRDLGEQRFGCTPAQRHTSSQDLCLRTQQPADRDTASGRSLTHPTQTAYPLSKGICGSFYRIFYLWPSRYSRIERAAVAPSPTALATCIVAPLRTSPLA